MWPAVGDLTLKVIHLGQRLGWPANGRDGLKPASPERREDDAVVRTPAPASRGTGDRTDLDRIAAVQVHLPERAVSKVGNSFAVWGKEWLCRAGGAGNRLVAVPVEATEEELNPALRDGGIDQLGPVRGDSEIDDSPVRRH